jgi:WD40 repeat protein/tRNA A-37 threonylcarbamoyl transferase component Bud32
VEATSGGENWRDATEIGRQIDEACDRFEAACRGGNRPLIEDFLRGTTDPDDRVLFRYLLAVELDYRAAVGETPEVAEYRQRFPGYQGLIDSVFARFASRSRLATGAEAETIDLPLARDGNSSGSALSPAAQAFPSIPGCVILSELGRGGMGVVYKARQVRLNRLCALKIALPGKHTGARFLAEAGTIARLRHPNIVQIYDLGEHEGLAYFEMEYIEGGSLARRLDGTPWAPGPAAGMIAILARAIGDAHRLGIVHRDLKPANVLFTGDETPKVVDFGLAKSLEDDSKLTQSGVFIGTPSYAAPEQVEGKGVGPAADIYALGAIFYQMLTGRPPFQAATVHQTLEQVKTADPVLPSRLQPGLPRDAETIALKCLEKDPLRRYADAAALADDLDRFLSERPILARPTGPAERLRKLVRRRPAVALLSLAVLVVTTLSFSLVAWQWRRAEAKAAALAAANTRTERARLVAYEGQARLTLHQALALCDQGDLGRGVSMLAHSLELAAEASSPVLDRPIRINLADWAGQLIRPVRLPLIRHSAPILGFAFCHESKALIAVGTDGIARLWDTATGKEIFPRLELMDERAGARLERVRFGPAESGLLGTIDDRGRVTVWDLAHRRRLASSPSSSPTRRVRDIAFPTSHDLVTCSDDGILHWSMIGCRGETPASQPIEKPAGRCQFGDTVLAVSSDGRTLATGGRHWRVLRWDVATKRALEPQSRHDSTVRAIALTPDGNTVVTGRRAGRLHIWDAASQTGFDLPRQGTEVTSLAVSADGRMLASGTEGGLVRLWDTSLLGPIGQTCKFASAVTALAFDPHGRIVAIGGEDGTIRFQEVPRQKALGRPVQVDQPVLTVTFGDGGRRLLIGTTNGSRWCDLVGHLAGEPGEVRGNRPNTKTSSRMGAAAVSPDGRTLAISRQEVTGELTSGRVEVRDTASNRRLMQTPDQPHAIAGLAYSPDSKWLLTWGKMPKTARLWDVATLRDSRPVLRSLDSAIRQAVFSSDGRTLLLGGSDGRARRWNVDGDVEVDPEHRPRHSYPITAVAFDPNRSRLVTACHVGTLRFWDATRGTMINEMRENTGEIAVLAFSPDGAMLVTASFDGTARFLDSESGRQLGPALHHADAVLCAAFHPDGKSIVTGTRDGMVQRWSTPLPPKSGGVAEIQRWARDQTGVVFDGLRAETTRMIAE